MAITDYTRLEYIQSSGTQYIKTNVLFNCSTDELEYEFEWVSVSGNAYDKVFGAIDGSGYSVLHQWDYNDNKNTQSIAFGYNKPGYKYNLGNYALNTDYTVIMNKSGVTLNGTAIDFGQTANVSLTKPYFLFCLNNNGSIIQYSRIKLKKFIHKRNGTIIHNFIPVARKSDNVAGLYDEIDNVFYLNSGTSTFTQGPKLQYYLTITVNPTNTASIIGGGYVGSSASIMMYPIRGYTIDGWYKNGSLLSSNNPYTLTVTGDTTIVAKTKTAGWCSIL